MAIKITHNRFCESISPICYFGCECIQCVRIFNAIEQAEEKFNRRTTGDKKVICPHCHKKQRVHVVECRNCHGTIPVDF